MNFEIAPPPKTVDGLLAVPIDIASIAASLTFDGAASSGAADATITYTVGPTSGNPIFDLRQTIDSASLDGVPLPVAKLAHHSFGSEPFTDLRVIDDFQAAGSVHTLRVQYGLTLPASQLGGAYLPALTWSPGPRLRFALGLSDLNRARYVEAWLPANLIFDQFSIELEVRILNTAHAHTPITNGAVTGLGSNHWQIAFPSRFSALSPMLELHAADALAHRTDSVVLPVSGSVVTIDTYKPAGSAVDLAAHGSQIAALLTANEQDYGGYVHGHRFVAFVSSGGMEYEGATTTSPGALAHETFHSWFARGLKPASQADGWWDEAYTKYRDDGANDAIPFDFTEPPVLLCSRDPWQRHTPTNAYTDGNDFFKGAAALIGIGNLNALMSDLYEAHKGLLPVSTARLEEHLVGRSANTQLVSAFHRFVYGLADQAPAPDLWIRDAPADPGADAWAGEFWDSPDLWIRNSDDGGTTHQAPEFGQDNWFCARVRNRGAGTATHFVVTFRASGFAGTQFLYPGDFLPAIAAKAEFDLEPGGTRIVRARWPAALVPAPGAHTCLLAAVLSRSDMPVAGRHVFEHNNLAQKNLTIVDLVPGEFVVLPIVIANLSGVGDARFDLEILRDKRAAELEVSLVHRSKPFLDRTGAVLRPFLPEFARERSAEPVERLDCGGHVPPAGGVRRAVLTSAVPELVAERFPGAWEAAFGERNARLPIEVGELSQTVVGLRVQVPATARPGRPMRIHLVQRSRGTKQPLGGVAVQINVLRD